MTNTNSNLRWYLASYNKMIHLLFKIVFAVVVLVMKHHV